MLLLLAETPDDTLLMARLAAGDSSALGPIHDRYRRRVAAFLLRVEPMLPHDQVDDLIQDVFLTLWETAPRYRDEGKLLAWIFGIATRRARGAARRIWIRRTLLRRHEEAVPHASPEPDMEDRLSANAEIEQALSSLGLKFREVLILHAVEGLSGPKIAAALGIAENTVWTRLHRARREMARALGRSS